MNFLRSGGNNSLGGRLVCRPLFVTGRNNRSLRCCPFSVVFVSINLIKDYTTRWTNVDSPRDLSSLHNQINSRSFHFASLTAHIFHLCVNWNKYCCDTRTKARLAFRVLLLLKFLLFLALKHLLLNPTWGSFILLRNTCDWKLKKSRARTTTAISHSYELTYFAICLQPLLVPPDYDRLCLQFFSFRFLFCCSFFPPDLQTDSW